MITLSGNFGGKVYTEEVLPAQEIMKMFGIENQFKVKKLYFKYASRYAKTHELTREERVAGGFNYPAFFVGTYNGSVVSIRYFTSQRRVQQKNTVYMDYVPRKIERIRSKTTVIDLEKELELGLYLYLYPKHGLSPMAGSDINYIAVDPERDAVEAMAFERKLITIQAAILSDNIEKLREKAFELVNDKDLKVQNIENLSESRLREILIQKSKFAPGKFVKAWESGGTSRHKSLIQRALDLGVLEQNRIGNKEDICFSSQAYQNSGLESNILTTCVVGHDIYVATEKALISNQKALDHLIFEMQKIDAKKAGALSDGGSEELTKAVESAEEKFQKWLDKAGTGSVRIDTLINYAFNMDVLYFDRAKKVVYILDEKGGITDDGFCEIKDGANYKGEMVEILNKKDNAAKKEELKAILLNRLTAKK